MTPDQFEQSLKDDPDTYVFLQQIARDAADAKKSEIGGGSKKQFIVTGVDTLLAVVAYSIYRWVKDCLDHKRAEREIDILKQQERVIAALIQDGFSPKEAQAATLTLLNAISKRADDDPVIKKLLMLGNSGT